MANELYRNTPNARTQRQAVIAAAKSGATTDSHIGVTWQVGGVTHWRKWHELTPAQQKMIP